MKHLQTHLSCIAALWALGCPPPARLVPLRALPESDLGAEHLDLRAVAELQYTPNSGWDLVLDMHLRALDGARPLVDMSRVMWRSDGLRWTPCRLPPEEDPDTLRLRLREEESIRLVLRCEQVRRPAERIELRLPVSGAGGKGYVDLVFPGVDNASDTSPWELD
jgi:hypothetical protein